MQHSRSRRSSAFRRALLFLVVAAALSSVVPASAGTVVREKTANLDISLRVRDKLRAAGVSVLMTRASDKTLVPSSRTGLANARRVDAFISIHNNASTSPRAWGTDVYRSLRPGGSKALGSAIARGFRAAFGPDRRVATRTRRGDHGDYYYQLREPRMAAALVEGAFVSNPTEGKALGTSASFRQRIADSIVAGILRYQRTLVRSPAPRLEPGTVLPAPLPPPTDLSARALGGTRVALGWTSSPLVHAYRIYRNGVLIAVRKAPARSLTQGGARMSFTDGWAAPGQTYGYEVRAVEKVASGVYGESIPASASARTPAISVVLDPGHGGRDPGAVRRY